MRVKQVAFSFIMLFLVILLIPLFFPISFKAYNEIFLDVTPTGVLSIEGAAPQVLNVYADDVLADYTINNIDKFVYDTDCNVQPVEITAEVYDDNGDCDLMHLGGDGEVEAYICNVSQSGYLPYCDENNYDFTIPSSSFSLDVDNGLVCNFTANLDWSYYQRWGNWSINITVLSPADESKYNSSNGTFYRSQHQEFIYPPEDPVNDPCLSGSTVDLGTLQLVSYNNGTGCSGTTMNGKCYLFNAGNMRLNVTWNATNFTHESNPGYIINVTNGNFSIDDDFTHLDGAEIYMSDDHVQVEFPTDGDRVERCGGSGSFNCDDDEDGNAFNAGNKARFNITWHIYIPVGIIGGNYQNQIWANSYAHEDGW